MNARRINIVSLATAAEAAIIRAAAQHVARALTEAGGVGWDAEHAALAEGADPPADAIVVTSLGPDVAALEDWPATEARLRARYARWAEIVSPLFICTVLRHVEEEDPAERLRRLVRIRRLNLLAARISHETGALVIDLDRTLADLGALRLGTDYRLAGIAAQEQGAKTIALSVISHGLDHVASVELQDGAAAIMTRYEAPVGLPEQLRPQKLLPVGRGRRKQVAAVEAASAQQRHVFLIRQLLARQIGPGTAAMIFVRAVRHVGLRESLRLLAAALRRAASPAARG